MARLIRTVLLKKIHVPGLFQAALVGTGFVTLRLLQSPSTVTFFIFEVALAITLPVLILLLAASGLYAVLLICIAHKLHREHLWEQKDGRVLIIRPHGDACRGGR